MKREYLCPQCGKRVECEPGPEGVACPSCGCEMDWAPTGMNFSLKGKGWTPKGDR